MDDSIYQYNDDIKSMGLEQMRREKVMLASELKAIEAKISELAFKNYGTYADAGRTTHDCSLTFADMRDTSSDLETKAEVLNNTLQQFREKAKELSLEQEILKIAQDKSCPIWDLLSLPTKMDVCIRAGYYDLAYSLTNYGMQLQQQPPLMKNNLIKKVATRLVEARSYLLEELFNKFAGPLDLAESIKVVNNVRKMPYLTPNQLRIAVLQHRDMYLEKQLLDITGNPDYVIQAIEIYRTCIYETLVLYFAVFPENELQRRDIQKYDPRWESWPLQPPSSILSQWTLSNIKKLLELIESCDSKSSIDISAISSKLMLMVSSFGRMGLDFRPIIASRLSRLIEARIMTNINEATQEFISMCPEITILDIDPSALPNFESAPNAPPVPSSELSLWDELTIYTNSIVECMNSLRHVITPSLLPSLLRSMNKSLSTILSWLSNNHSNSSNFENAIKLISTCMVPFLEQCVQYFFPNSVIVEILGSNSTKKQFSQFARFDMLKLSESCENAEKLKKIIVPILKKKTIADINLDSVMKDENILIKVDENSKQETPLEAEVGDGREEFPTSSITKKDEPESALENVSENIKDERSEVQIESEVQDKTEQEIENLEVKNEGKLNLEFNQEGKEKIELDQEGNERLELEEEDKSNFDVIQEEKETVELEQEGNKHDEVKEDINGITEREEEELDIQTDVTQESNEDQDTENGWGWNDNENATHQNADCEIKKSKGAKDD